MSRSDGFAEFADAPERGLRSLGADLGLTSCGLSLMVFRPGQQWRIHTHEHQEEVYLVLAGELTIIIEDREHVLGARQSMRVAPGVRRQLVNRGSERVEFLAVGASGEHVARDARAWASWDEPGDGRPPGDVPLPEDLHIEG